MDSKTCHRFEVRALNMDRPTHMVLPGMCHPRQSFDRIDIIDADAWTSVGANKSEIRPHQPAEL